MARAYKCDLCGKYVNYAFDVSGINFKTGERHDEFFGKRNEIYEVKEVCSDCHDKLIDCARKIWEEKC